VVIGYEIQLLSPFLTTKEESRCSVKSVRNLSREAAGLTRDDRVRRYQLDYHTAEAVIPALEINVAIAEVFGLKSLRIPGSDFERGLLADLPISARLSSGFWSEVVRSARIIARKYQCHGRHGDHIAFLCARLFEQTRDLHQLDDYDGQLLEIAAILHEVGGFVSPKAHHKHSQYLIENSEIFGLARHDVQVVALVARYHRHSGPRLTHPAYAALPTGDRIRVSKLAALLRVADALERTHTQRVTDVEVSIENSRLILSLTGIADAAVERLAMVGKGDLFQDVFGLPVVLQEKAP
jgi:exopolyphosphatase/guanosine-5'-triphosphate,3'-diphosphate pyrophosphatase